MTLLPSDIAPPDPGITDSGVFWLVIALIAVALIAAVIVGLTRKNARTIEQDRQSGPAGVDRKDGKGDEDDPTWYTPSGGS